MLRSRAVHAYPSDSFYYQLTQVPSYSDVAWESLYLSFLNNYLIVIDLLPLCFLVGGSTSTNPSWPRAISYDLIHLGQACFLLRSVSSMRHDRYVQERSN